MAKARQIEGLTAEQSYGEAAARIVAARSAEMTAQARGVLDTSDIDRVHDMRVATRRLRAALEVFEPCFPRKRYRRALRDVKRLADALGERRDRDVAIVALRRFNDQMPAPEQRGVESLIDRLRDEQAEANLELAPQVEPKELRRLGEDLAALAEAAAGSEGR